MFSHHLRQLLSVSLIAWLSASGASSSYFLIKCTQARTRQAQETANHDAAIYVMETSYTHANAALTLLDDGNLNAVVRLYEQRLELLSSGFSSSDTSNVERQYHLAILANEGDVEARDELISKLRSIAGRKGYGYTSIGVEPVRTCPRKSDE